MPRILVTGASGFIGSALCPALLEAGWEVATLQRTARPPVHARVTNYAADFRHDPRTCRGIEDDTPPVTVGHRFRIDGQGGIKLINYTCELQHADGHYMISYNFGSLAREYDFAAPDAQNRMRAADTFAAIERRAPAGD